jgi:sulfite reductase alpha subunit-like flavoprotein
VKTNVFIKIKKGTLIYPNSLKENIILIGPGTGVAPHISYLQERNHFIEE